MEGENVEMHIFGSKEASDRFDELDYNRVDL